METEKWRQRDKDTEKRETHEETNRYKDTERQTDGETEKWRRRKCRQNDTYKETNRYRDTERQTDGDTDKQSEIYFDNNVSDFLSKCFSLTFLFYFLLLQSLNYKTFEG